jgi:enamine deaminase RidA (YjgF/YER057c/UK114 family)
MLKAIRPQQEMSEAQFGAYIPYNQSVIGPAAVAARGAYEGRAHEHAAYPVPLDSFTEAGAQLLGAEDRVHQAPRREPERLRQKRTGDRALVIPAPPYMERDGVRSLAAHAILHNGLLYISGVLGYSHKDGRIPEYSVVDQTRYILETLRATISKATQHTAGIDSIIKLDVDIVDNENNIDAVMGELAMVLALHNTCIAIRGVTSLSVTSIAAVQMSAVVDCDRYPKLRRNTDAGNTSSKHCERGRKGEAQGTPRAGHTLTKRSFFGKDQKSSSTGSGRSRAAQEEFSDSSDGAQSSGDEMYVPTRDKRASAKRAPKH